MVVPSKIVVLCAAESNEVVSRRLTVVGSRAFIGLSDWCTAVEVRASAFGLVTVK